YLSRLRLQLLADGVELALPGALDLGDFLEVVGLSGGLRGVADGGGFAAGDVVERLAPRYADFGAPLAVGDGVVLVDVALVALGDGADVEPVGIERPRVVPRHRSVVRIDRSDVRADVRRMHATPRLAMRDDRLGQDVRVVAAAPAEDVELFERCGVLRPAAHE